MASGFLKLLSSRKCNIEVLSLSGVWAFATAGFFSEQKACHHRSSNQEAVPCRVIPDRQGQIPVSTASPIHSLGVCYHCIPFLSVLISIVWPTFNFSHSSEFPDLLKHNNCKASHIIPSLANGQCYPDRIGQSWTPLHKDCWHGSRRRGVLSGWITMACVVRVFSQWIVMPTTYLAGTSVYLKNIYNGSHCEKDILKLLHILERHPFVINVLYR
jgi:hypothetical protein